MFDELLEYKDIPPKGVKLMLAYPQLQEENLEANL